MLRRPRAPQLSPWGQLVAVSGTIVAVIAVIAISWSMASTHERRVEYGIQGALGGMALDLGDADLVVERAIGTAASVEHVDRYGFDHPPVTSRVIKDGILRIRSRCRRTVMHGCSVHYRVHVPDNVPLTITTGSGSVALQGYRGSARIMTGGGDVDVRDWCGFDLTARADRGGDVSVSASCPPQQMTLRTTTGRVHVSVPPGRYRIDASTSGSAAVRGLTTVPDSPFTIQALSGSGPIVVERES